MDDEGKQLGGRADTTNDAISNLLYRQNIYPETTAERFLVSTVTTGKAIWLANDVPIASFEDAIVRPHFSNLILSQIYKHRQNNQDVASLYQWTNYHGPFTPRELELIELTMALDKTTSFADQIRPNQQNTENKIRAEFLSALISSLSIIDNENPSGPAKALHISGANITGNFDISHHKNLPSLHFTNCIFEKPLKLNNAGLKTLTLRGTQCPALFCNNAVIDGPVILTNGFTALGPVEFISCEIKGPFKVAASSFQKDTGADHIALSLKLSTIHNSLILGENFYVDGKVDLSNLKLELDLLCSKARIINNSTDQKSCALNCDNIEIKGNLNIVNGTEITGGIHLRGAKIANNLTLSSSLFQKSQNLQSQQNTPPSKGPDNALWLQNCRIGNNFSLLYSTTMGRTKVKNCTINGDCNFSFMAASNKSGNEFHTALRLVNNTLGGDLKLEESTFEGLVEIHRTIINGTLGATAAILENTSPNTKNTENQNCVLSLNNVTINANLDLSKGFIAKGDINLTRLSIEGDLLCESGHFHGNFTLKDSNINGTLNLDQNGANKAIFKKQIIFENTHTKYYSDNIAVWPAKLIQHNFSYEQFTRSSKVTGAQRLNWLARNGPYQSAPYTMAINAFEKMGKPQDAKIIAIERSKNNFWGALNNAINQKRSKATPPSPILQKLRLCILWPVFALCWLIYGGFMHYGHTISRILITSIIVLTVTVPLYYKGAQQGIFAPKSHFLALNQNYTACTPERGGNWTNCTVTELPGFSALIYSLDNFLPLIDLGQQQNWRPMEKSFMIEIPIPKCLIWEKACLGVRWMAQDLGSRFLNYTSILETIIGWITLLGLGVFLFRKTTRHQ